MDFLRPCLVLGVMYPFVGLYVDILTLTLIFVIALIKRLVYQILRYLHC